jgi:hypothetical protein
MTSRPTQAPLNREEQKRKFEALQHMYKVSEPIVQNFSIESLKPEKLNEEVFLKSYKNILEERGLTSTKIMVEKTIEENKTTATIKQFYCIHTYSPVRASIMGLPIRYKICSKCGLVK